MVKKMGNEECCPQATGCPQVFNNLFNTFKGGMHQKNTARGLLTLGYQRNKKGRSNEAAA